MELTTSPDSAISLGYDRRASLASFHLSGPSSPPEQDSKEDICNKAPPPSYPGAENPNSPDVAPKTEELDGDTEPLSSIGDAKPTVDTLVLAKKRGRPRKYPVAEPKKPSTVHTRSKTGCGTCRLRKKKCDEALPGCMNCHKNNIVCDGYQKRLPWQSGKQKLLAQLRNGPPPPLSVCFIPGTEDPKDYRLFSYFKDRLGHVLTIKDEDKTNPFLSNVMPMALNHEGLMHSLLYISSSSLARDDGRCPADLEERQIHHEQRAFSTLRLTMDQITTDPNLIADESVAQSLLLCLQTICGGDVQGNYVHHLKGMKTMLTKTTLADRENKFIHFAREFLVYHEYCSAITSEENTLDVDSVALLAKCKQPSLGESYYSGTLIGVLDGLFEFIRRIRALRDKIRKLRTPDFCIVNHNDLLEEAEEIHDALLNWECGYAPGSSRYIPSLLYRQCANIYLYRTCWRSERCDKLKAEVDQGLELIRLLPQGHDDDSATQSILLMPLFILGCSAFESEHQVEIAQAFQRLEAWSSLQNIQHARMFVEEVWQMMEDGRAYETWDWEGLMVSKKLNFLVT